MVMTFFPDSASVEALSATADVTGFDFDRAAERLTDLSLLDVQQADLTSEPRYVLHPLVQSFAAAQLVEQAEFEKAARGRWVGWYVERVSKIGLDDSRAYDLLHPEVESINSVLEWAFENNFLREAYCIAYETDSYFIYIGLWDKSMRVSLIGADAAKKYGDIDGEVIELSAYVQLSGRQEDTFKAERYLTRLQNLVETSVLSSEALFEYHCAIGWYNMALKKFRDAEHAFQSAISMVQQIPEIYEALGKGWLGLCLYRQERFSEARHIFCETREIALQCNNQLWRLFANIYLADLDVRLNDLDSIVTRLEFLRQEVTHSPDPEFIAKIHMIYFHFYILDGNLPAAHSSLLKAIDIFERTGQRRELAEAREELARLEAQMAAAAE
jgi:tetratricopeptide (TPR) repeat protein